MKKKMMARRKRMMMITMKTKIKTNLTILFQKNCPRPYNRLSWRSILEAEELLHLLLLLLLALCLLALRRYLLLLLFLGRLLVLRRNHLQNKSSRLHAVAEAHHWWVTWHLKLISIFNLLLRKYIELGELVLCAKTRQQILPTLLLWPSKRLTELLWLFTTRPVWSQWSHIINR